MFESLRRRCFNRRTIDEEWDVRANDRLFSYTNNNGETVFTSALSDEALLNNSYKDIHAYSIFAPDALLNHVSGDISKHKANDTLVAYTDGSFTHSDSVSVCSYGIFMQCRDAYAEYAGALIDQSSFYNSTGAELVAVVLAIKCAIANGYKSVEVVHDFNGCSIFEGDGRKPKAGSKMYWIYQQYEVFLGCVRDRIDIKFSKVKSHSLDLGNDHADFLASNFGKRYLRHHKKEGKSPNLQYGPICDYTSRKLVFIPKTASEKNQHSAAATQIQSFYCRSGLYNSVIAKKGVLEYIENDFVWGRWAAFIEHGFTEEELLLVRILLAGACSHKTISSRLGRKRLRSGQVFRSVAEKLGVNISCPDPTAMRKRAFEIMYLNGEKMPSKKRKRTNWAETEEDIRSCGQIEDGSLAVGTTGDDVKNEQAEYINAVLSTSSSRLEGNYATDQIRVVESSFLVGSISLNALIELAEKISTESQDAQE